MNEEELLELLKEDASSGMEVAIDRYGKAVKVICSSILSGYSAEDIEEAVSDTFVGLWKAVDKIYVKNGTGLKEYLYGIARKTALNRRRTLAGRQKTQDIDQMPETAAAENIEEQVVWRSVCDILIDLIRSMDSPDREIFACRYLKQYPVRQIAGQTGMTEKAVENRLFRGRAKLRKQLKKCGVEIA